MPRINPATGSEHHMPGPEELDEIRSLVGPYQEFLTQAQEDESRDIETEVPPELKDDPHLTANSLFGMLNMELDLKTTPTRSIVAMVNERRDLLSEAGSDWENNMTFWFTELVQNAMDAKWDAGAGADEMKLKVFPDKVVFSHNGRPPHFRDPEIHGVVGGDEFQAMVWQGSTKRAQLESEGRFGIGFKFWTFHFSNASIDAEGWRFGWHCDYIGDPTFGASKYQQDHPMTLTFSKPKDKLGLAGICERPEVLIEEMKRLMSGIVLLDRKTAFILEVDGKETWRLQHEIEEVERAPSEGGSLRLFSNSSSLEEERDQGDTPLYVPERLLTYSIKIKDDTFPEFLAEQLHEVLTDEFESKPESHSVQELVKLSRKASGPDQGRTCTENGENEYEFCPPGEGCSDCWPDGSPTESAWEDYRKDSKYLRSLDEDKRTPYQKSALENCRKKLVNRIPYRNAAKKALDDITISVVADLGSDDSPRVHQLLYSMFPIGKESTGSGTAQRLGATESRFAFKAPFDLQKDRETLSTSSKRNDVLAGCLTFAWDSLMSVLTDPQLREELKIDDSVYRSLLEGVVDAGASKFEVLLRQFLRRAGLQVSDIMRCDTWPGIEYGKIRPKQVYNKWSDARVARPELRKLLSSQENSVVKWAFENIHPMEAFLLKGDGVTQHLDPWLYSWRASEDGEELKKIETEQWRVWVPRTKPDHKRSKEVATALGEPAESIWPEWLPLPLKQKSDRKHTWRHPADLTTAIVDRGRADSHEGADDLLDRTLSEAEEMGITKLVLSGKWEPLHSGKDEVRGIPIGQKSPNQLYATCVNHIIGQDDGPEKMRKIVEDCGQKKKGRWPVFLFSDSGDLLMVEEPEGWKRTLIATNDEGEEKSLWTLKSSGDRPFFQSISEDDPGDYAFPRNEWPKRYVKNLSDPESKYTHIVIDNDDRSKLLDSYKRVVDGVSRIKSYNGRRAKFSSVKLTFTPNREHPHLGDMMNFRACTAYPIKAEREVSAFIRKELPKLPGLIHGLFLPVGALEDRASPIFREIRKRQASKSSHPQFATNRKPSLGFLRHVLRIPNEDLEKRTPQGNSPETDHHRMPSESEKQGHKAQSSNDKEEAGKVWEKLVEEQGEKEGEQHGRNYSLLLRMMSPEAAAFEIAANEGVTSDRMSDCLCLASAAHMDGAFSQIAIDKAKDNRPFPFRTWVAYWSVDNQDVTHGTQRLFLERLSFTGMRTKDASKDNIFSNALYADSTALEDYYNRAGIGSNPPAGSDMQANSIHGVGRNIRGPPQDRSGNLNFLWMPDPEKGKLIEMAHHMLADDDLLPVDYDLIMQTEKGDPRKASFAEKELKGIKGADPYVFDHSERERKNILLWLLDPRVSELDEIVSTVITHATDPSEMKPELMLVPEAIWNQYKALQNRAQRTLILDDNLSDEELASKNNEFEGLISNRLARWRGDEDLSIIENDPGFKTYLGDKFKVALLDAKADEDRISLLEEIRRSPRTLKGFRDAAMGSARINRIWGSDDGIHWRVRKTNRKRYVAEFGNLLFSDSQSSSFFRTEREKLTGGGNSPAYGFSVTPDKRLLQVSKEEKQQIEDRNYWGEKSIETEQFLWASELEKVFQDASTSEDEGGGGFGLSLQGELHYGFIADRLMVLAAAWHGSGKMATARTKTIEEFLRSLPPLYVSDEFDHKRAVGDAGRLSLGNGGWSLDRDDEKLWIRTASNSFGRQGMEQKIEILDKILSSTFQKMEIELYEHMSDKGFKRVFDIDDDSKAIRHANRYDPLESKDRQAWLDSREIHEIDAELSSRLDDRDWLNSADAKKKYDPSEKNSAIRKDIRTWISKGAPSISSVKDDLLLMYPNHQCTLLDFGALTRQPIGLDDEEAARAGMYRIRLRGHEADAGKSPIAPSGEPLPRSDYENILNHVGNTLIVSAQAFAMGSRKNGWRLIQPPGSRSEGFLPWLNRSWVKLFDADPDSDFVILDEVVRHGGEDDEHDERDSLQAHKLHLLYIMAFQKQLDIRIQETEGQ